MNSKEKKDHWLDYGDNKYSTSLIADTKVLMKLVYLFSPTIVFWALFEQQVQVKYFYFTLIYC